MMVLFDLPVLTKRERKAATAFRMFLLDQGFEMSQFSVYLRHCVGREQTETLSRRIEKAVPATGKVHIVLITDKQYETIVCFDGRIRQPSRKNPEQYVLF
ncbi:CRISPR-associated endonuclease Cas2 [Azospirillum halopraeferens]|uniref:CRISPR-associated endonuclease Cas2 n=1 Tax=Azospirillum halopraeferens TaxID=34010 RepID=UPI001FE0D96E|nr:CRISPR-associated endonuclease Cas2 [Azospirillum halopraeferens]